MPSPAHPRRPIAKLSAVERAVLFLLVSLCGQGTAFAAEEAHVPAVAHAGAVVDKPATDPVTPADDGTPRLGIIQGIALPFKPLVPTSRPREVSSRDEPAKPAAQPAPAVSAAPAAPVAPAVTAAGQAAPTTHAAPPAPPAPALLPAASTLRPIFAAGRHRSSMRPSLAAAPVEPAAVSSPAEASGTAGAAPTARPAIATAASLADEQPLEHLRQRLAETFGSREIGGATVRVTSKGGAPAAAEATAPSASRRSSAVRLAAASPTKPALAAATPVDAAAGVCGTGQRQSPIDLANTFKVDLDPVAFHYQPTLFAVVDNGRTVQARMAAGNGIEVNGRRYELDRIEFRHPAEERIDGRTFPLGVHLVHRDSEGRQAVVAVVMEQGASSSGANPVVQAVWNNLPLERGEAEQARAPLDVEGLLPSTRGYFTYMGSMTAPPCEEGVLWVVMKTPMSIATPQVDLFARLYPMNARGLQATNGRMVKESN